MGRRRSRISLEYAARYPLNTGTGQGTMPRAFQPRRETGGPPPLLRSLNPAGRERECSVKGLRLTWARVGRGVSLKSEGGRSARRPICAGRKQTKRKSAYGGSPSKWKERPLARLQRSCSCFFARSGAAWLCWILIPIKKGERQRFRLLFPLTTRKRTQAYCFCAGRLDGWIQLFDAEVGFFFSFAQKIGRISAAVWGACVCRRGRAAQRLISTLFFLKCFFI